MTTPTPASIAERLSEAQRAALLSLPSAYVGDMPDQEWLPYYDLFAAALTSIGDDGSMYATDAGCAVRAHLTSKAREEIEG